MQTGLASGRNAATDETSLRTRHPAASPRAADLETAAVPVATILVVDDEPYVRAALARSLRRSAAQILLAADAEEAEALLGAHEVDLVIADHGLPGRSGLDFLERCRSQSPAARRVLITGHRDFPLMREAIERAGVAYFLTKPWDPAALRRLVADLLDEAEGGARPLAALVDAPATKLDAAAEATRRLARVLSALNAGDTVDEIIAGVAAELARLVPAREIGWWDEEERRLHRLAGGSAPLAALRADELDDETTGALHHGRSSTAPIVLRCAWQGACGPEARSSVLLVPVRHRGRVLGVVVLVSGEALTERADLLGLAAALAEPVAVAVDRARLREFVAAEKALWESAFDAIADPVLIVDDTGHVLRANRAARERAPLDVEPERLRCTMLCRPPAGACPAADGAHELRGLFGRADRSYVVSSFPLAAGDGHPERTVRIYRDVTQERALQRQLSRSEQLSTVGKLAAGVAHEIRNPLAAMTNAVSLLRGGSSLCDEEKQLVEIVLEESRRVNRIVGDFLSFARPGRGRFAPSSIGDLVASTLVLLRKDPRCSASVSLDATTEPGLPDVVMDHDQVRQVVWNLLLNAVQAVGRQGRVVVRVARAQEDGVAGVRVEVTDDGPGLPEGESASLFDPFETTKPNGTGLGLSMARHIVELHRGRVRLENARPGARACFWLPIDGPVE